MGPIFQQLHRMRSLLANPARWTKGYNARNAEDSSVFVTDPDAKCFCLFGATILTTPSNHPDNASSTDVFLENTFQLYPARGSADNYICWNDDPKTTHEDIIQFLDYAVNRAEVMGV